MQDITNLKLEFEGATLTRQHTMVMDKFSKFSHDKMEAHYDEVALNFDGVYLRAGYPDPIKVAEYVSKYSKNKK